MRFHASRSAVTSALASPMEQMKKIWHVQTVLPWEKGGLFPRRSKTPLLATCLTLVIWPQNAFRNSPTSMSLISKWSLFFSWSMFDASQPTEYTACFKLPTKYSTGHSCDRHSAGLRSLTIPPVMLLKELQLEALVTQVVWPQAPGQARMCLAHSANVARTRENCDQSSPNARRSTFSSTRRASAHLLPWQNQMAANSCSV